MNLPKIAKETDSMPTTPVVESKDQPLIAKETEMSNLQFDEQKEPMDETNEPRPGKINQLLHDPDFHQQVQNVKVILGIDEATKNVSLVFGLATLSRIIRTGQTEAVEVIRVPIFQATSELEALLVAVAHVNGYHDYGDKTKNSALNTSIVIHDRNPRVVKKGTC